MFRLYFSKKSRKRSLIILVAALLVFVFVMFIFRDKVKAPVSHLNNPSTNISTPDSQTPPSFDKKKHSTDQSGSIWVIVNKQRPLPGNYVPAGLVGTTLGGQMRQGAASALNNLSAAAKKDGVGFKLISGYRSYVSQASVYSAYVKADGQAKADTYSARPGHSEHQTGLAADLGTGNCDLNICFGDTAAGKWLAAHAHEHGFIIRYQRGKESITGYQYEPWHLRYVGPDLSQEMHTQNILTLEEFFALSN